MDNYESRPLLPMPFPKPLKEMTDEELSNFLTRQRNYNMLIPALIEANSRKDKQIVDLTKRIKTLEKKALEKPGRPRREFWFEGQEVTDEYLMQLIDEGYFESISKLERYLGAGKNQLRNRYNKAKEKLRLERTVQRYADC